MMISSRHSLRESRLLAFAGGEMAEPAATSEQKEAAKTDVQNESSINVERLQDVAKELQNEAESVSKALQNQEEQAAKREESLVVQADNMNQQERGDQLESTNENEQSERNQQEGDQHAKERGPERPMTEPEIMELAQSDLGVEKIDSRDWPRIKTALFGPSANFYKTPEGDPSVGNMGGALKQMIDEGGGTLLMDEAVQRELRRRVGVEKKEEMNIASEAQVREITTNLLGLEVRQVQGMDAAQFKQVRYRLYGSSAQIYAGRWDQEIKPFVIMPIGGALGQLSETMMRMGGGKASFECNAPMQQELRRRVGMEKKQEMQRLTQNEKQQLAAATLEKQAATSTETQKLYGSAEFFINSRGEIQFDRMGGALGTIKRMPNGDYQFLDRQLSDSDRARLRQQSKAT